MKINLVSDLHLEFAPIDLPGGETLFLAGDIVPSDTLRPERTDAQGLRVRRRAAKFFQETCAKYKNVYYVMGNHEHYHGVFEEDANITRAYLTGLNIQLLDNDVVELQPGTQLFGGTLWTNYHKENPVYMDYARRSMNDHYVIARNYKVNGRTVVFSPEDALFEHKQTIRKLNNALCKFPNDNFVVMTHHCPSYGSIHPKYGTDPLNFAFSSDLSELILDNPRIKVWVHGHTHTTFKYMIGDCRVLCNPRGYARLDSGPPENAEWDPTFSFEV